MLTFGFVTLQCSYRPACFQCFFCICVRKEVFELLSGRDCCWHWTQIYWDQAILLFYRLRLIFLNFLHCKQTNQPIRMVVWKGISCPSPVENQRWSSFSSSIRRWESPSVSVNSNLFFFFSESTMRTRSSLQFPVRPVSNSCHGRCEGFWSEHFTFCVVYSLHVQSAKASSAELTSWRLRGLRYTSSQVGFTQRVC